MQRTFVVIFFLSTSLWLVGVFVLSLMMFHVAWSMLFLRMFTSDSDSRVSSVPLSLCRRIHTDIIVLIKESVIILSLSFIASVICFAVISFLFIVALLIISSVVVIVWLPLFLMLILVVISANFSIVLQVMIIVFIVILVLLISSVRRLMLIMMSSSCVAARWLCRTAMKVVAVFITFMCYFAVSSILVFPIEDICGWSLPIFTFHLPVLILLLRLKLVWALYLFVEMVVSRSCLLHLNRFVVSLCYSSVLFVSMSFSLSVSVWLLPDKTIFLIRCPSRFLLYVYACRSCVRTPLITILRPLRCSLIDGYVALYGWESLNSASQSGVVWCEMRRLYSLGSVR